MLAPDEIGINAEVERLANLMLHDGIPADEQDRGKLEPYARQVRLDACNISESDENRDEKAMNVVYEALLYRKMKASDEGSGGRGRDTSILDQGSEFGAGFS